VRLAGTSIEELGESDVSGVVWIELQEKSVDLRHADSERSARVFQVDLHFSIFNWMNLLAVW
jgi:hypothetical protein